MAHLLNYKYEIFPTKPQRYQLFKILRQVRLQWNRAVTIRKKLIRALTSGQFDYVIETLLSEEKNNYQGQRRSTISKILELHPDVDVKDGPKLYDTKNLIGNLFDDFGSKYLDTKPLVNTLEKLHQEQVAQRKKDKAGGVLLRNQTRLTVYWQLVRAINNYAGYAAKQFVDKSFMSPKGMSLSTVRANISGYANSIKWNTAVKPSAEQRRYGAPGEPRYKRRGEGFTYQIQRVNVDTLIRKKRNNKGNQVIINPIHNGNAWIDMKYHRPLPEGNKIKQMTVNENAGHFFVVFSVEVPDHLWSIAPMKAGWHAGIDPGVHVPLTVGMKNVKTGESSHMAIQYGFIEKSADKLEKIQQRLAKKQGPRRKRTETEVEETLKKYGNKRSIRKMDRPVKEKTIEKEKARLERTMIFQESSKSWRELNQTVRQLQYRTANQRRDVLHKISRVLTEGCDLVAIGHWEPEREIGYRKKLRALKKKIKRGDAGAKKELEALKAEKSKQGPKGARKRRRGGRDRSIATLRRLIDEKAQRSGANVFTYVNEAGSTMTCSICGDATGPKNDMSIREWRCENCNTVHNRDLNGAFNILIKAYKDERITAAQAVAPVTEQVVTRTKAQGATGQSESDFGFRATEPCGRGDLNISKLQQQPDNYFYPKLWDGAVPKALNSLKEMGIVSTLAHGNTSQNANAPP